MVMMMMTKITLKCIEDVDMMGTVSGQLPTIQVLVLMSGFIGWLWSWWGVVLVGNYLRDSGPGGQWLSFIFIRWGLSPVGSCPRTNGNKHRQAYLSYCVSLGQTVASLGGELVDSVHDCTHLITDKVRRTVKFLCCLARGVTIVTPDWLEKSKSSKMFTGEN